MSSPKTHSLRVVVQHSRVNQQSPYRLIAYGGEGGDYISGSAEFESLNRLLKALHSVAPDFDESALSILDTPETYIAFAGRHGVRRLAIVAARPEGRQKVVNFRITRAEPDSEPPQTRTEAGPREWHRPALSISMWESER